MRVFLIFKFVNFIDRQEYEIKIFYLHNISHFDIYTNGHKLGILKHESSVYRMLLMFSPKFWIEFNRSTYHWYS